MTKKIIEITVETERILFYQRRHRTVRGWCVRCDSEVSMATPVEAASLAGVSPSVINRLAEAGTIHSVTTDDGEVFICLKSLRTETGVGL